MSETLQSDLSQKALSAVKYTVIYRTISQLVGIVTLIVLVRLLSKHDYGVYHLLYSVIALIGMVASLGIANTLQRFMPEYYSRGEFVLANKLYRTFSLLRLLSNVLILGVLILFWDFFGTLLKISEYKNYFLLFSLVILLHMQRGLLETCLASYFLQKYSQKLSAIFALIKGIGYTLAFIMRWNLWLIIIIDLLAYIIIFILLQMIYSKKIPKQGV
ncbi:MAG: hypothetical protein CSA18_05100 [Deltaproteobacteria bacterium]|nr:MAG: hypothetical protein CSA18_05100 [Deltaproteobacteria bacterium]